jgi:hypothetical protein
MFNENSDVRKEWLGFSEDMVLLKKINW